MMKKAFRTFLNLLLAASLAVMPLNAVLAGPNPGSEQHTGNLPQEPCHQAGHEGSADNAQGKAPLASHCSCCSDDANCPDDATCDHTTASPVYTLPIDVPASRNMLSRVFITALPCTYYSLNSPPDPPPPLA